MESAPVLIARCNTTTRRSCSQPESFSDILAIAGVLPVGVTPQALDQVLDARALLELEEINLFHRLQFAHYGLTPKAISPRMGATRGAARRLIEVLRAQTSFYTPLGCCLSGVK